MAAINLEHEQRAAIEWRDKGDVAGEEQGRCYSQAGAHLRLVKKALPHGKFLPWCKANRFEPSTVARWMREATNPAKRERRLEVRRACDIRAKQRSKNGTAVPHLPTTNYPPEIDNDLLKAPEETKSLPSEILRAFTVIAAALPKLTKVQRTYVKRSIPRDERRAVGQFFYNTAKK